MSSNSIVRIAGIAGILSVVLLVGLYASAGPEGAPSGPLSLVLSLASIVAGVVFAIGLYLLYRGEAATLSLIALAVSIVGQLLFLVSTVSMSYDFNNPVLIIADILVYVVGVPLFSWLVYTNRKMPRPLAIVGFLAGLAGVGVYVLKLGAGVDFTNPTSPLAGVASIFYYAYFLLAFGWVLWTGYILLSSKTETAMATA